MIARYDAVVVGGGPAGCAAAISLVRTGARILLVERSQQPAEKAGEVLDAAIYSTLASIGIDTRLMGVETLTLAGRLTNWSSEDDIDANEILNPLGYGRLVRRSVFDRWLLDVARSVGVSVVVGARNVMAERNDGKWRLRFEGGDIDRHDATCPLIIEATGRGPGVLGKGRRLHLDQHVALIAYVPTPPNSYDQRLIVEAVEEGWWYGALLPGHQTVIAFISEAWLFPRGTLARRNWWCSNLRSTRLITRLAPTLEEGFALRAFPADSSIRQELSGPGWVALGDAASAYDPLLGRGVVLSLTKGSALARLLCNYDRSTAIAEYVAAERSSFMKYIDERHSVYRSAAHRFTKPFWSRYTSAHSE
jgi:flavin-dependent dehydrogenase